MLPAFFEAQGPHLVIGQKRVWGNVSVRSLLRMCKELSLDSQNLSQRVPLRRGRLRQVELAANIRVIRDKSQK